MQPKSVHLTTASLSAPIVQDEAESASPKHYPIAHIIICMRTSATMLRMAEHEHTRLNDLNRQQAELLSAAADDLEAQTRSRL